jgi:hypothetical protein
LSIVATFLATLATILSDRLPISKIPVAKRRKKRKAQQLLVASPIAARLLSVIPTVLAPLLSITATFLATLAACVSTFHGIVAKRITDRLPSFRPRRSTVVLIPVRHRLGGADADSNRHHQKQR